MELDVAVLDLLPAGSDRVGLLKCSQTCMGKTCSRTCSETCMFTSN
jgi:hypothetical protein